VKNGIDFPYMLAGSYYKTFPSFSYCSIITGIISFNKVIVMLKTLLLRYKRRRRKLLIWKKRLEEQLHTLTLQIPAHIRCSLDISWGPFYGGTVIVNRTMENVKIIVQIPYDGFLTEDEQNILIRYQLRKRDLPYFILFHEFSHLMDAIFHLNHGTMKDFRRYLADCQRIVQDAPDYRKLPFEEQADRFAYQCILQHCSKAC